MKTRLRSVYLDNELVDQLIAGSQDSIFTEGLINNGWSLWGVGYAEVQNNDINWDTYRDELVRAKESGNKIALCTPFIPYCDKLSNLYCTDNITRQVIDLARELDIKLVDLSAFSVAFTNTLSDSECQTFFDKSNGYLTAKGLASLETFLLNWTKKNDRDEPLSDFYYGAELYPEVWPRTTFIQDVKNLSKTGMNFVRLGEFFWKTLEPREGEYHLEFLEDVLQILKDQDIKVLLGIPTPTPPRWFTLKYPNSAIKNIDGTEMVHGSRQHVCTNNPDFRRHAYQLTRKIATVARKFDNVIGFQIDNEFKCHVDLCYCDSCRALWHEWLTVQYGTIQQLNKAWGTAVWSEEYDNFVDVVLPTKTPFLHNSALMNAFRKFTAASVNEFAHGVSSLLCLESDLPITHNTGLGFNLDNQDLFSQMDFAGFDTYPHANNYPALLFNLNLWRNLIGLKDFMLLETSTSHVGHIENYVTPNPSGYLPIEVLSTYVAGAKGFDYWLYRAQRFGVEQTHSAVVTQWGTPDLGYDDVVKAGQIFKEIEPVLRRTKPWPSKIAMIYSDESRRFYNIETGGIYNYRGLTGKLFESLQKNGVLPELIYENANFSEYNCLLVPFIRHISACLLEKLQRFTNEGGKLILGPMTGDRTSELTWHDDNGLGRVGSWLGLQNVVQYYSKASDETALIIKKNQEQTKLNGLITAFTTSKKEVASFETEAPVIGNRTIFSDQSIGKGRVIYLGGLPEQLNTDYFWKEFIAKEIRPLDDDGDLIENSGEIVKYCRSSKQECQLFLINLSNQEQSFQLKKEALDLKTGVQCEPGSRSLGKYDYLALSFSK